MGSKRDFAKPGVDTLQQGHVYASGEKDRDREGDSRDSRDRAESGSFQGQPTAHKNLPQLPYSSVGINLRSGRHRVKDDSRANYADVVEVDHEAQVMVVGDVAKYFDRVRKNVNKAFMRQVLREALGPYCERKKSESAAAGVRGWGNSTASLTKVTDAADVEDRAAEQHDGQDAEEGVAETDRRQRQRQQKQQQQPEPEVLEDHHQAAAHLPHQPHHHHHHNHLEKDGEDFFSDTTRDEEDWDGSQQSPMQSPQPSDDRRAMRSAFRARAHADQAVTTAVKPGMDKAGLSSLRSLRQGLPGGDDHDDTRSLRSLAMVGRSDSYESRRSRR